MRSRNLHYPFFHPNLGFCLQSQSIHNGKYVLGQFIIRKGTAFRIYVTLLSNVTCSVTIITDYLLRIGFLLEIYKCASYNSVPGGCGD